MNKIKINYFLDILLAISFIIVAITGIILFLKLVPKHTLVQLHDVSGIIFIILSLTHIVLHFNWFVCVTKSMFTNNKDKCEK